MSVVTKGTFPTIKFPTKEELLERELQGFEGDKVNPNNLSFWYDKIKDCGFKTPETVVISLDFKWYHWMRSDNYKDDAIQEFADFIKGELEKSNFDTNRVLFLKTGVFSNKFDFKSCKLEDLSLIGRQFLTIFYASMLLGAHRTAELVVREFIGSSPTKLTIYNGMPLNTEFRVFYDFDKNEVLNTFNYWDREVMSNSLKRANEYDDSRYNYGNFMKSIDSIEAEYHANLSQVIDLVSERMKNVKLAGKWSIDIMKVEDELYLIDMALAKESYFFEE